MRILHCIPTFEGGGAERQLSYLAPATVHLGADVHVVFTRGGTNLARVAQSGVHLHRLATSGNHDPRLIWKLNGLIREVRPALVQTWLPQMDIVGSLGAILNKVPCIISERTCAAGYGKDWKARARLFLGRGAAAIVANSRGGQNYWSAAGMGERTVVISNGIPVSELRSVELRVARERNGVVGPPVILFAGRYNSDKNVLGAFDAVERALEARPGGQAVFRGEGPCGAELILRHKSSPCSNRIYVGRYSEELWEEMAQAAVFVAVSTREGHPNAVLEAAALGCPLVLSDIPGHREFLEEDAATFVQSRSPDSIADGILWVLDNPAMAAKKAERARQSVGARSVEAATRQYVSLYESVLNGGQCRQ